MVAKSSAEHISRQGPLTSLGQGQSWGWAKRSLSRAQWFFVADLFRGAGRIKQTELKG